MSSGDDAEETILTYHSILLNNYCTLASTVFLVYEYLITIRQEVELYWHGRWTGATVLFFSNRYLVLLDYILLVAQFARMSDQSCVSLVKFESVIDFLEYVPFASFSALRAYALSRQNWPLSVAIFLLGLVPLASDFAQFHFGLTGANDPLYGCSEDNEIPAYLAKRRTSLMLSDAVLLALTWSAVARPRRMRVGETLKWVAHSSMGSISSVMLRDGMLYFLVLLVLNVLHLTFTQVSIVSNPLNPTSFITDFTSPITSVLTSRFLLDLQAAYRRTLLSSASSTVHSHEWRGASASTLRADSGSGACTRGPLVFAGFDVVGSIGSAHSWKEIDGGEELLDADESRDREEREVGLAGLRTPDEEGCAAAENGVDRRNADMPLEVLRSTNST